MKYTDEYLNSRVSWFDKSDDTIIYHEVPEASTETVDHFFMSAAKLCTTKPPPMYLVIDLTEAELPTAELRRHISKRFKEHVTLFEAICIFSDKSQLINIAAQFIIGFQPELFKGMSVHSDLAHCLTKIDNVKKAKGT